MTRVVPTGLLATGLTCLIAGSAPASAEPAAGGTAASEKFTQCMLEGHPRDVRWLKALVDREIPVEPEVAAGAFMNSVWELMRGCVERRPSFQVDLDLDGFLAALQRMKVSGPPGAGTPEPMDGLGDCFVRVVPQEAMAFVRESDIGASRQQSQPSSEKGVQELRLGYLSNPAFDAMLSKSLSKKQGCGPILKKLDGRVDGNRLYSRINWLLRAEPRLGAGK